MRKRLLSILLTVCMLLSLLPGVTLPALAAGEGTGTASNGAFTLNSSGVNIISNADQLAYVAQQVNAGTYGWDSANYKLGNDINLTAYSNWTPIGKYQYEFNGVFDGGGHTISNLKINTTGSRGYGLFGDISNGTVKNVGLSGVNINVTSAADWVYVGGLAGNTDGTIENCSVTGAITGTVTHSSVCFGGLVGRNYYGTVKNCYTTATVSVSGAGSYSVGGLAGTDVKGYISYSYWLSTATAAGVGSGSLSGKGNCGFTGTNSLAAAVTVGGTETLSLLDALNAWLNNEARTDLYTWVSSASYPVFGPLWTPPTYTATVTVQKDGSLWSGSGKSFALCQSGVKKYDLNVSGSNATVSALTGTYDVFDGAVDTGVNISLSSGGGNAATVNYYTLTLAAGAGSTSPTGGGVFLAGKNVPIDVTVNTGYQWSKWTSGNTSLLPDQTTKSTSIAMPAGSITLTATAAPAVYTINYTLNGATVTPANPINYNVQSAVITLNTPTREGYSFLGWTGSNGMTAQTNVSIPAGSTGNKTYTANWKANKPTAALDTSIVTAKTDTSLTITTQDGYEYSVDNGAKWCSAAGSYTFTGLAPNTAYNLIYRKAAVDTSGSPYAASDASEPLPVTTKKSLAEVAVPDTPTVGTGTDKPTSSSITVDTVARYEYYISNSATADWSGTPNGYFKEIFDGSHKFDSLTPGTQYYIHVRVAETDSAMPSASNSVSQYTLPETPIAGVGYSVDYTEEKISVTGGYEVNTKADFTGTAVATNASLTAGASYYVRVAASGGVPASEAVSFTIPARPATPIGITAENIAKTKAAITILNTVAEQEYQVNGTWYTPADGKVEVTGLAEGTEYPIVTRVKATANSFASLSSEAFTVKTKTDGRSGFALPTISVTPTYAPGQTLSDIALPTGWTWDAPATVPTVINTGYGAIYTPTDTDTVDYSGVTGYAVDGSGKVTITRVVPLTVNRTTPTAADFTFTAPASLNFSGTVKTAAVTAKDGISGMGAVTVKYYDEDGAVVDAPTNAGTYTVKINVVQGDNYAAASDVTDNAWSFTIEKAAQATLTITNKPAGVVTYGDSFKLETAGGSGTGAVTWTPGGSATVNEDTGEVTITGVGETTITATKAADANYADVVTATYTFTPARRLITVGAPSATGGWTKTYDGKTDFDKSVVTVGGITNKVGSDDVNVTLQSANYDTADVGSGNKTLTITYAIDGTKSDNYSVPNNTVVSTASITAATPTITLKSKTEAFTGKKIEIDAASVNGITCGTTADGAITYIYYTKDTCTDADKTTVDKSAADTIGGAPKNAGTYYVKANIAASGNYLAATSAAVTLTIYYPSSGDDKSSAPVIVDGKAVDMGISEVKDGTTTVRVDQNKMSEQLKNAKDSVEIPIASRTDTASAQLVVQNVENMAARSMTLTVKANDISYEIPTISVDTAAILKNLGASDSSKVPLNVTISKLSNNAVTIKDGKLMVAPVAFTVSATYNGKSIEVDRFESYVQRVIEIPSGVDPRTITTAVVAQANGTQRHVPTKVYSEGGKWYAKINSMTNSTYALIQNSVSFTDTTGKWYANAVTELASREVISGIGENMFAGERAITRTEFAAILVRALGLPADGTSAFSDVSASAWYSGAVATAAQYGLVTGKGGNSFDPNANITRQEAMTMLQRAAKLTGYLGKAGSLDGFADEGSINSWAVDAAKWSVGSGLIQGSDGKLNPTANISRAESATVILRLLQKTGLVDGRSEA